MALRGEPTGAPWRWAGDVAATAKRDLEVGETLDGGCTVYGALVPAPSRPPRACCRRPRPPCAPQAEGGRDRRLTLDDVELDRDTLAWELRTEILKESAPP
ncbi:MAG: hypothetical protein R3D25_02360 [Geminicoccaceae bacterium]